MNSADAVDRLIREALGTEGVCESPPNTNHGPYVERVLKQVGLKAGDPWCAAALYDIGYQALGKLWPLPKTGGCAVLGGFATIHDILEETPEIGDVFLIYHAALKRFGHTGIVIGAGNLTLSGNTSGAGLREGWLTGRRVWSFTPQDRFIRWTSLLKESA